MRILLQDLRYAGRMLLKHPGFTGVAALALALGIGANSAIFSVINAVLLRPLPYQDPDRIITIWETNPHLQLGFDKFPCSAANFIDWREQNHVFGHIAALSSDPFNLEGRGEPEKLGGARVSADLFAVLGVEASLGRAFLPEEDQPGHNHVVVLSHSLWQRRFGSDPGVIGQAVRFNGESYTVVGVMPPGFHYPHGTDMPAYFQFPAQTEVWSPIALRAEQIKNRGGINKAVIARLKPGVTLKQAQAEMDTIAQRIGQQYPDTEAGFGVTLIPLHEQVTGSLRPSLLTLLGAVGFVLAVACANVANLLLARAAARQKEIAIRTALGAGRWRIVRQLLTESVLLSSLGGGLGLLLGMWGIDLLIAATPENIPRFKEVSLDARVLGFTLVVSLLTGIIFGLAPALQASKPDLNESLKEGGRGSTSVRHRVRSLLVISEVALALVLLIGAGLMIKSFLRLQQVDPGLDPHHVLTMRLSIPYAKYSKDEQRIAFYRQLLERTESLPGVQAVGAVSEIPLSGAEDLEGFTIEGRPPVKSLQEMPIANYHTVTPDYFRAMGITLLKGRQLTEGDKEDAPGVVIINETFAHRFFPGEDAIGKRVTFDNPEKEKASWNSIVGVVRDVKHSALDAEPRPEIFRPFFQSPGTSFSGDLALVARTVSDPLSLAAAIRNEVWAVDKEMPVYDIETMDQIIAESVSRRRFNMLLLGVFAAVAMILATVGIYGVMSYTVSQRTHEIGIRMALGAERGDVLRLVVGQGMMQALAGVAIGLAGAFAVTRVMASLLYGVSATDPVTFIGISLLLAMIALIACYIPARRAMKVDPMVALRYE